MQTENKAFDPHSIDWHAVVESHLPEKTYLTYVDYTDNLDDHVKLLESLLTTADDRMSTLYGNIYEWYSDNAHDAEMDYLLDACRAAGEPYGLDEGDVREYLAPFEDSIRDTIRDRDQSDALRDLCRNTGKLTVRMELQSNHDCMNSNHAESSGDGYKGEESYFADVMKALCLNPAEVQYHMHAKGITTRGLWPTIYRGDPAVRAEDLAQELLDQSGSAVLLTIIGLIDVDDLLAYEGGFRIPAGASVGFYGDAYGSGSIFELKTIRDVDIYPDAKDPEDEYYQWRPVLDGTSTYSMDECYAPTRAFWGETWGLTSPALGESE
jgi:hypothetical protein